MKVILTQEVKGKGHEGDVVEVARGYAVNYLLPRKLAIHATAGNLKQLAARMSNISKRNEERRAEAEGLAASLNGKMVVIEAKAGDEGKLFGSVTTSLIEAAVSEQLGAEVDHRRMDLHRPIKTTGDFTVVMSVFGDVKAEVIVRVVPEGGAAAAAAAAAEPAVVEEVAAEEPAAEPTEAEAEGTDEDADTDEAADEEEAE